MTITFNNNVSFATADNSSYNAISVGVLGSELDNFTANGWFALYNALGINYRLNSRLSTSFQIGSRYGLITAKESIPGMIATTQRSRMQLGGGGYIAHQFNNNLLMQAGLAFMYENDAYSNNAANAQNNPATRNASGGTFNIAIPIRMSVVFGN